MMWRKIFGSLLIVGFIGSDAWSQEAAKPERTNGENLASWLMFASIVFVFYVLLMIFVVRRQKRQNLAVARSLEMADERLRLARKQIALQEETNRLLERLIAERDPG
jgi:hypothetical protein